MGNMPKHNLVEEVQSSIDGRLQIGDVLGLARQLTTASGLAFGFMLYIAVNYVKLSENYETGEMVGFILVSIALVSTATAIIILLLLPLLYAELSFPIGKKQTSQFYVWSRRFILCAIALLSVGIYSSVFFALSILLPDWAASVIAAIMFVIPLVVFELRRIGDPTEVA